MNIGKKIKQRREELGLSQQELADRMGYKTRNAIHNFEQKENMKLSLVSKFASALSCTPAELLGWENEFSEENAAFSVDMLRNPTYLRYAKKLFYADEVIQEQVYSYIDFLLSK